MIGAARFSCAALFIYPFGKGALRCVAFDFDFSAVLFGLCLSFCSVSEPLPHDFYFREEGGREELLHGSENALVSEAWLECLYRYG